MNTACLPGSGPLIPIVTGSSGIRPPAYRTVRAAIISHAFPDGYIRAYGRVLVRVAQRHVMEVTTREAYTYQIGKHILPWFGPMRMNEIMAAHVREWVTHLQAENVECREHPEAHRLRAELEDTETRSRLTAKNHRVQAVRGAYLDALGSACQRLDVSPPQGGDRVPLAEIYRVEAALRQRGLDVRATAVR